MQIVIRCNDALKAELLCYGVQAGTEPAWVNEKAELLQYKTADAVVDLLFENTPGHVDLLRQLTGLKIVNSVSHTLQETDAAFVRINGWPTFLKAHTLEASALHEESKTLAETVFSRFGRALAWLPDEPGFVVPRVVSMIINEAYFALEEGVSTRAEIDMAMKLGTAYPYGLLEWSEKIGSQDIAGLLQKLSAQQPRYQPAPLLLQQAAS